MATWVWPTTPFYEKLKTLWKHLKTWKLIVLVIDDNGYGFIVGKMSKKTFAHIRHVFTGVATVIKS